MKIYKQDSIHSSGIQRKSKSVHSCVDNRPATIIQRRLQEAANGGLLQVRQLQKLTEYGGIVQRTETFKGIANAGSDNPQNFYLEESDDVDKENGSSSKRSKLNDEHKEKFTRAIENSKTLVANAIEQVKAAMIEDTARPSHTRIAMMMCFGVEDKRYDKVILQKLMEIGNGLKQDGLRIKDVSIDEKDKGIEGVVGAIALPFRSSFFMPKLPVGTPVQIPSPFGRFNLTQKTVKVDFDLSEERATHILIHEMSHRDAGTGDVKYGDPGSVEAHQTLLDLSPTYKVKAMPDFAEAKGVWNADSYAYFVGKLESASALMV